MTAVSASRLPVAGLIVLLVLVGCKGRSNSRARLTEEETPALATMLHVADPRAPAQLVSGFYDLEGNAWRWTKGHFSVILKTPPGSAQKGAVLQLRFTLPDAVISKLQKISLSASIAGTTLEPESYTRSGQFVYTRDVPANRLASDPVKVDFALDKALPPGPNDQRELGVVVSTVGFEVK